MKLSTAIIAPLLLLSVVAVRAQERITHGRFSDVALYRPRGEVHEFVIFLSDAGGWDRDHAVWAQALAERGALVAGVDLPGFAANLADNDACVIPTGDLENLAHYLQGYAKLPAYFAPLLIGAGASASFAYAMLAQAPEGMFSGAISLGFCPEQTAVIRLCETEPFPLNDSRRNQSRTLKPEPVHATWIVLRDPDDRTCTHDVTEFTRAVAGAELLELTASRNESRTMRWIPALPDAYQRLTASRSAAQAPAPPDFDDLPVITVDAVGESDLFAILLSGDGGWAGLDKEVAAAIAARGIPVVGFDSLRYFWTARTPQELAAALDRIVDYFAARWQRSRVLLIGYSQGANVLPFAVNRLAPATRTRVARTVLLGVGAKASFEFHLGNWFGSDAAGLDVAPELAKLSADSTLCIYGTEDRESICASVPATQVQGHALLGDHHFDGAYEELAALILAQGTDR